MDTMILTGSVYGFAEDIARVIESQLIRARCAVQIVNDPDPVRCVLRADELPLFIVSTTGNGDIPKPFKPFVLAVASGSIGTLPQHYALIALGDSAFTDFCGAGRKLEAALVARGMQQLHDKLEFDASTDIDYEDVATDWTNEILVPSLI
ncbi:flavodoxin domain-containing protein [Salinisphaera sp. RV14]|uniref:flavodoxin domain-containing protein n=1 Tax=Salinisphaera sp. RV14 TaxID=3454140 RepID=UPI003F86F1B3